VKVVFMDPSHLDEVYAIETESFYSPWSRKELENELNNPFAIYVVVIEENRVIGYGGMWHVVTEGHITNIAVSQEERGKGYGRAILEEMIRLAYEKEMIGITLEVRVSNLKAQKLYTSFGFKIEGYRKEYYADTREDALIMWKHLGPAE